ncbi:MAG: ATP-binding cassette domain-containing protein [Nitrospinaceae bacterium]|nr:ATP-binding cassette domain-containing protein [Nitrospinaceae bacterium]NIR57277.1 ATP-binding cassette domain-containing protein [Nitrospinaceae bacterium]NIS87729.1 ATP-binding cassette domain-containing protein [Nitrospinaceae bacterium]NIT84595.1 ATP-binding cassette domain-containing protein [Nitrospinaceae bacterium]NIU46778.1 ATP-binding cassette domain-containing protein [Nitrospinaceae bacterium]
MDSPLVEIRNADVYLNGFPVLHSINWVMRGGENWAVVGNNGAGKTSFLKLIFGELIPVHGGRVSWFGVNDRLPLQDIRQNLGYISAEYQADYAIPLCGWEVVASGFFSSVGLYESVSADQKKTALEWMDFLGIATLADKGFHRLSYGEARRVLLARALVHRPRLLVLDEPCAGLDLPTREIFLKTLEKLSSTDTQLIYVTHHVDEIGPALSHVLFLKNGTVFRQGKKEPLLTSEILSEVFDCPIQVRHNEGRTWVTGIRPPRRGPPFDR